MGELVHKALLFYENESYNFYNFSSSLNIAESQMASASVEVGSQTPQKMPQNGMNGATTNGAITNGASTNGHHEEKAEHEEMQYLNLIKKIIDSGEQQKPVQGGESNGERIFAGNKRGDRTGTGTLSGAAMLQ